MIRSSTQVFWIPLDVDHPGDAVCSINGIEFAFSSHGRTQSAWARVYIEVESVGTEWQCGNNI